MAQPRLSPLLPDVIVGVARAVPAWQQAVEFFSKQLEMASKQLEITRAMQARLAQQLVVVAHPVLQTLRCRQGVRIPALD